MPYDVELANRLREQLDDEDGITERAMFGGRAFLLHGNMVVSAFSRGGLMVRVGPAATGDALAKPHTEQIMMRGREMVGWIHVDEEGLRTRRQVAAWTRRALEFGRTLPPKR
jgi:TfoX/Sxy family transcriptional regulator of competence genes